MGPAAYHRQAEPETVSREFVVLSSRLLLFSMFPLVAGICMDFYLIAQLIVPGRAVAATLSTALFLVFFGVWFVLPHVKGRGLRRPR